MPDKRPGHEYSDPYVEGLEELPGAFDVLDHLNKVYGLSVGRIYAAKTILVEIGPERIREMSFDSLSDAFDSIYMPQCIHGRYNMGMLTGLRTGKCPLIDRDHRLTADGYEVLIALAPVFRASSNDSFSTGF